MRTIFTVPPFWQIAIAGTFAFALVALIVWVLRSNKD
jgi:hypothetical protein